MPVLYSLFGFLSYAYMLPIFMLYFMGMLYHFVSHLLVTLTLKLFPGFHEEHQCIILKDEDLELLWLLIKKYLFNLESLKYFLLLHKEILLLKEFTQLYLNHLKLKFFFTLLQYLFYSSFLLQSVRSWIF
jgi:hypothetical protein